MEEAYTFHTPPYPFFTYSPPFPLCSLFPSPPQFSHPPFLIHSADVRENPRPCARLLSDDFTNLILVKIQNTSRNRSSRREGNEKKSSLNLGMSLTVFFQNLDTFLMIQCNCFLYYYFYNYYFLISSK